MVGDSSQSRLKGFSYIRSRESRLKEIDRLENWVFVPGLSYGYL